MRIATRGSALALWQARHVASLLGDDVELVVVETTGDKQRDKSIVEIGGRGIFVKEVQAAVRDGRADVAVHSAKDLQSTPTPALTLAAFPERGDARDALVGNHRLDDLPTGARVATGSPRRRAQLASRRPDLTFADLRGNIGTRLEKASQYDAVVVAAAALDRLEVLDRAVDLLPVHVLVPQVGQGALAVECRSDDDGARERLRAIDHAPTRRAVEAERAFLAEIGSGCDLPVGAHATIDADAIELHALLATDDGRIVLRHHDSGTEPIDIGKRVARYLLDDAGGSELLDR